MDTENFTIAPWANTGQMQIVATRQIAKGEMIIEEEPLVWCAVADRYYPSGQWDLVDKLLRHQQLRRDLYSWGLSKDGMIGFDQNDQAVAHVLSARYNTRVQNIVALYATVCTNNIGSNSSNGTVLGYGIFRQLSRSNHACDPSATWSDRCDSISLARGLVALRDIQAGEPITWRYLDFQREGNHADPLNDFHVRNWLLVDRFGFACKCALCLAQMPEEIQGKDVLQIYHDLIIGESKRMIDAYEASLPPGSTIKLPSRFSPSPSPWRQQ